MSTNEQIEKLLNSNDKAEFCIKVKLVYSHSKPLEGVLALILHNDKESCLLFVKDPSLPTDSPKIIHIIPVNSNLKIETAQFNPAIDEDRLENPVVTFSVGQNCASVIFLEQEIMSNTVKEIEDRKSTADQSVYEWVKLYNKHLDRKSTSKAHSLPISTHMTNSTKTLRYVLPNTRAETLASINLKRTRTLNKPKQRLIDYKAAKDHYMNAQLMKNEEGFVDWEKATAFVGTWNVHDKLPDDSLKVWLKETLTADDGATVDPDFYVIGLQEIDPSAQSYVWYNPTIQNAWVAKILECLNEGNEQYYKVEAKQLVTILLIVIAKKGHKSHISEISSNYVGIGALNMAGNKGGVGVRLRFHDGYLCFVTSHLAAYMNQIDKRNQDFASITRRLFFPLDTKEKKSPIDYVTYYWNDGGDEGISFVERQDVLKDWTKEASVFHNDILVWCGDLNYRINYLKRDDILKKVDDNRLDELLEYDQLIIERNAGRTFQMFNEGRITFHPTYKYNSGTDEYDTSKKKREPAWTDRIMWKKERNNLSKESVELLSYTDCMQMKLSDHKPVRALMNLSIRHIDEKRQEKVRDDLIKGVKEHPDVHPQGQISTSFVDFENVHFMEYKEKNITLENPGDVIAAFRFLPNEFTGADLPPWLQISPLSGVLAPNEKVVIRFKILVDPTNSAPLNGQTQTINEFLLLRVENYKDYYINVFGQYKPTCFGAHLEDLTIDQETGVPTQLKNVIDYLSKEKICCTESLFLEHGELSVSTYIRKCLDEYEVNALSGDIDSELSELSEDTSETTIALSMADVLVALLECLPEPVIPVSQYQAALEASESRTVANFVEGLPTLRKNVLLFISKFLKTCIDKAPDSVKASRQREIVKRFVVLIRPPIDYKERNPIKAEAQLKNFLTQLSE